MAENVGGIYYDIEARTQGLIEGERQVKRSTAAIGSNMERIGASATRMNTQVSTSARGVTTALSGVGRSAGQAGIQIQQFIGQVQGGVNPMVALSQQGADLGFVLGAPLLGAVVGISASLASMLLPALFSNKDAADDLKEAVEKLGSAIKIEDGVASLTERITELAKVSESAAKSLTMQEMINATNVLNASSEKIFDSFSSISNSVSMAHGAFHLYRQALDDGTAAQDNLSLATIDVASPIYRLQQLVAQLNSEFKLNSDQSYRLAEALFAVKENADGQSIQNLQNVLGDLTTETGLGNKVLVEFASGMDDAFSAASNAAERLEVAEKYLADFDGALDKSKSVALGLKTELDKLIGSLKFQAETTGMSEREVAKFVATQLAAKDRTIDLNKALSDINAYFDRIEAQEALTVKTKEQEQALKQAKTAWDSFAKSIETQSAKAESAEAANQLVTDRIRETGQAAGKSAEEIQALVDAQNRLFAQQQQQQEQKQTDRDAESRSARIAALEQEIYLAGIKNQLGNEEFELKSAILALGEGATDAEAQRIASLVTQMHQLRMEAELLGPTLEQSFNQTMLSSLDQFSRGMADIVLSGASAQEVFHSLASTIATELLTSIIRYYVGQAAAAVTGAAATTAAGVATAAALGTAYATPAALVSLASFGANAVPAAAGIASTVALSQALALGSGRLNGGDVYPGMMHPVTEDGKPELLIQGGRQYLLPGSRGGEVVSNQDMMAMGSGGASVTVNVINQSSNSQTQETRRQGPNNTEIVDIIVSDIQQRGKVHNAITNTTTAGNRI